MAPRVADVTADDVAALFDRLYVPRGAMLYVQSSMDWTERAGFTANEVMRTLTRWIEPAGTLVMPSYPTAQRHLDYLASSPRFDVNRTPTVSGLLAEMLRRTSGAIRSLDPDFPVCAIGREAAAISGGLPDEADPFGVRSPYQRMLDHGAVLVGLGVSHNTSSFIHVIDSRAAAGYPTDAYDSRLFDTTVVDVDGRSHLVRRRALRPEFQQLTAPSAIIESMQPGADAFTAIDIVGARFFRWDLGAWASWCLEHARAQAAHGRWPCWLSRLSDAA